MRITAARCFICGKRWYWPFQFRGICSKCGGTVVYDIMEGK